MAIVNYICSDCEKKDVCKNVDVLLKFDADAKKQLGVDIRVLGCKWFSSLTIEDEDIDENETDDEDLENESDEQ